jgi:hypothetical protein
MGISNLADPLYIDWHTDPDTGEKITISRTNEPHVVTNAMFMLDYIPNEFNHAQIYNGATLLTEIKLSKEIALATEYKIDYTIGKVYVHSSLEAVNLVCTYFSRGIIYFPSSRVMYSDNPALTIKDKIDSIESTATTDQTNFTNHVAGTTNKHSTSTITYDDTGNTKVLGDNMDAVLAKIEAELVAFISGDANAEVGSARNSAWKSKVFTDIDGRFESLEQGLAINVLDNGLSNGGVIGISTALNALATTINVMTYGADVFFPRGTYLIDDHVTLNSKMNLILPLGSIIKIANGKSLTGVNTKLKAGLHQIFDLSLGGALAGSWDIKEVYPEWFGALGIGTDDTTPLQNSVDFAQITNSVLTSNKSKVYGVVATINVKNKITIQLNNASIKAISAVNKILNINIYNSNNMINHQLKPPITHIKIDCNNLATHGLYVQNYRKGEIGNIDIVNVSGTGMYVDGSCETTYHDIHAHGSAITAVGLHVVSADSNFVDCMFLDCHTGFIIEANNTFTRCHAWMYTKAYIPGSICFDVRATRVWMQQCYPDTYQYHVKFTGLCRAYINQLYLYNNDSFMDDGVVTACGGAGSIYAFYFDGVENPEYIKIRTSHIHGPELTPLVMSLSNLTNFRLDIDLSSSLLWTLNSADEMYHKTTMANGVGNGYADATFTTNKLSKLNGINQLDLNFSYALEISSTLIKIGNIPAAFRPAHQIDVSIRYGVTSNSTASLGMVALFIDHYGDVYIRAVGDALLTGTTRYLFGHIIWF